MITMDRNGVAWVGNIYQKFEAMCLEVEGMMYEDAIKYVENQVVTVGESVKKLYSDVFQEILMPPSVDADKIVVSAMPEQKYFEVEAFEKSYLNKNSTPTSRLSVEHANSEPVKRKKDSDVIPTSISDRLRGTGNLCTSANAKCVKPDHFDSFPKELVFKRNLEKNKLPPSKTPAKITRRRDDCMKLPSIEELNKVHEVHHDVTKLSSIEHSRSDFETHSYHDIENANKQTSFAAVCDNPTSEKKVARTLTLSSADLTEESNGLSDQETWRDEFSDLPEITDAWCFCPRETDAVAGSDYETQQDINKLQLEETCVVVSKDDCHCISQVGANSRPSKNKLRKAFSSSRKSASKHEYEQLAVLHRSSTTLNHGCIETTVPTPAVIDPRKAFPPETCESEWELL